MVWGGLRPRAAGVQGWIQLVSQSSIVCLYLLKRRLWRSDFLVFDRVDEKERLVKAHRVVGRATLNRAGIETWFLAVYQGRFAPDDDLLEPKNQVSKDITMALPRRSGKTTLELPGSGYIIAANI
jgi:hypothetical protein